MLGHKNAWGRPKVRNGRSQGGPQGRSGHGDEGQTIFVLDGNKIPIILSTISIRTEAPRVAMKKHALTLLVTPYTLQNEST
jgi:hypothetical protein